MAQIEQRLSAKVQKDTGMCEVLIRFFQGSKSILEQRVVFLFHLNISSITLIEQRQKVLG